MIGAALAIQVLSGTTTSSLGPTPSASNSRWIADVPEGSAAAWRTPRFCANCLSNRVGHTSALAYQAFAAASRTYSTSRLVIQGPATGMRCMAQSLTQRKFPFGAAANTSRASSAVSTSNSSVLIRKLRAAVIG